MARNPKENKAKRPVRAKARSAAKPVARKTSTGAAGRPAMPPYHHGDLHDALLQAAERVLERDGLAGLTLRAVAREAGVSHAAPTHHFGDLTGLVSELAAIGFRQFNAAMARPTPSVNAAADEGDGPRKSLCRLCAGPSRHVRADVPQRSGSTCRGLRCMRPPTAAFAGLARGVGASRHEHIAADALSLEQARRDRARLVDGPRLYHAAARRPPERHPAAAAEGHHVGSAVRGHAAQYGPHVRRGRSLRPATDVQTPTPSAWRRRLAHAWVFGVYLPITHR